MVLKKEDLCDLPQDPVLVRNIVQKNLHGFSIKATDFNLISPSNKNYSCINTCIF